MRFLPKTTCPKCKGPVTFFDVLGIITPFQAISCVSCGELIFLKYRWPVTFVALGIGTVILLLSFGLLVKGLLSNLETYFWATACLFVAEIIVTLRVVKRNELVVRKED